MIVPPGSVTKNCTLCSAFVAFGGIAVMRSDTTSPTTYIPPELKQFQTSVGGWSSMTGVTTTDTFAEHSAKRRRRDTSVGARLWEVPVADFLATVLAKAAVMLVEALVIRLVNAFATGRLATA